MREWSTKVNYAVYVNECSPLYCTYTTMEKINYGHALTILISLYGGFVFLLRLITPLLVKLAFKVKHQSRNIRINSGISLILS